MAVEVVPRERGLRAEAAVRAARGRRAGQHDEQVGAHRGEGLLDLRLRALADGDHGDDRADADDDAEHGREGAHLVAEQRAERDAQRVQGVHASAPHCRARLRLDAGGTGC